MALIEFQNVEKTYKLGETQVTGLKNVHLSIQNKGFVSFVGPSGSGKTTLLNLLGCIDKPTSGKVIIQGVETNSLNRKKAADFRGENIGFIFQNFNLLPVLTVYENIEFPLISVKNIEQKAIKTWVAEILNEVGLYDKRNHKPDQLSGGQRQRVAIARALVIKPRMVLADEPTANLDHKTALSIMQLMHRIKESRGTLFVFATHDPKIMQIAETIYELEDGVIINKKEQ